MSKKEIKLLALHIYILVVVSGIVYALIDCLGPDVSWGIMIVTLSVVLFVNLFDLIATISLHRKEKEICTVLEKIKKQRERLEKKDNA